MSSSANAPATVSVDDVHVHESGTVGSPAVVFVHGGGPGGRMWSAHLDRLSDRFHCLAPDLAGFGRSNHLAPLSLDQTADLLADLIERRLRARRGRARARRRNSGSRHWLKSCSKKPPNAPVLPQ
jgi:pimeloyl-ACP methyl ester carboxylesterase